MTHKSETDPHDQAFGYATSGIHKLGLSKREYFAAMAMQGLLSSCNWGAMAYKSDETPGYTAQYALECADKLIERLNTTEL